ncbi:ras guanine nucleotide exchange factor domain-containing protein, partial [Cubamyces menziesii]
VVSLILSHDKPKNRARQIEKFIDVANRLRNLHNYSGLRAIIAGINSATFEGDESLELLRTKSAEHWKSFQQWDQLLQSVRSHQKYRMALRNTKGVCIPALEIHLSDLIRAHEGNPDYHDDDPSKIHWAKFNMMARFIDTIVQCQKGCRESAEYERFLEREELRKLFMIDEEHLLMDYDMQRSRMALPDIEGYEDNLRSTGPRTAGRDPAHHKDAAIFRKLLNFSWA